MKEGCIFCAIAEGKNKAQRVYESEEVIAFKDLYPMAKHHFLFILKEHDNNISETAARSGDVGKIFSAIKEFTEGKKNRAAFRFDNGFRIVTNEGRAGGQSVFHTHFHLLAGETLGHFGALK